MIGEPVMTQEMLCSWLDAFASAQERQDLTALIQLFTPDVAFCWKPRELRMGSEAMVEDWLDLLARWSDVQFSYSHAFVGTRTVGICRWSMTYTDRWTGAQEAQSGEFYLALTEGGLCRWFTSADFNLTTDDES